MSGNDKRLTGVLMFDLFVRKPSKKLGGGAEVDDVVVRTKIRAKHQRTHG